MARIRIQNIYFKEIAQIGTGKKLANNDFNGNVLPHALLTAL